MGFKFGPEIGSKQGDAAALADARRKVRYSVVTEGACTFACSTRIYLSNPVPGAKHFTKYHFCGIFSFMTETSNGGNFTCDKGGRNCARKTGRLSAKAEATNTYTAELLDGFAERQRSLCAETTVRIALMAESKDVNVDAIEGPEEAQQASDNVEIAIADLATDRPIVVVACGGAKPFGGCGSYLIEE